MERRPAPSVLPLFRSRQQAEILVVVLGDPDQELSLTELSARTGAPHPSVHREIERAERAGLVSSRRIGNTRLVRANTASPFYASLTDLLTRAFGVPATLAAALRSVVGVEEAYLFGAWAAYHGRAGDERPGGDVDLLVLGRPDRSSLYEALGAAEERLGLAVQVTVRESGWLRSGSDSFHETFTGRPMLQLEL
ncbi:MAG: MarR family transcriptional regulator [Jiangellaceae bacterium]|nr:MarR family transcriptional regulator [Jiangellaceae bacterium]